MFPRIVRSLCGRNRGRRRRHDSPYSFDNLSGPVFYSTAVTFSLFLILLLYKLCKFLYEWWDGWVTRQVEVIVKGLPAHETLIDGRMCMSNDTLPYLFANSRFPYNPCSFPEISSACCNNTRCDASSFTTCHTYFTHSHSYYSCSYYGMACYTTDAYVKNHQIGSLLLLFMVGSFVVIVSYVVISLFKEHVNGGPYMTANSDDYHDATATVVHDDDDDNDVDDSVSDDNCHDCYGILSRWRHRRIIFGGSTVHRGIEFSSPNNGAVATTAIPSAPSVYLMEIQDQPSQWSGNYNVYANAANDSTSHGHYGGYGYGATAMAELEYPAYSVSTPSAPLQPQ